MTQTEQPNYRTVRQYRDDVSYDDVIDGEVRATWITSDGLLSGRHRLPPEQGFIVLTIGSGLMFHFTFEEARRLIAQLQHEDEPDQRINAKLETCWHLHGPRYCWFIEISDQVAEDIRQRLDDITGLSSIAENPEILELLRRRYSYSYDFDFERDDPVGEYEFREQHWADTNENTGVTEGGAIEGFLRDCNWQWGRTPEEFRRFLGINEAHVVKADRQKQGF